MRVNLVKVLKAHTPETFRLELAWNDESAQRMCSLVDLTSLYETLCTNNWGQE
jgi:hypothetical protein